LLVADLEGVGDNVLSMPLLSMISHAYRDHERHLLVSPGRGELFFGWDAFHVLEVGDDEKIVDVLNKYHELIFDLGTSTDHFTDWIHQGELRYGAYVCFSKPKSIPRELTVSLSQDIPKWQQIVSLASRLGIASDAIPEFEIQTSKFSEDCAEMLLNFRTELPMICLAPGAGYDQLKRWPPEYFAMFMRELHAKRPCRFVLVGDRSEMEIGDAITELVEFQIDNVIGLTTLGCLVQILKQSQLLVSNDNGVMHLGGAVGIPTIGLFGPSNPKVFSPLGRTSTVIEASSGNMTDIDPTYVAKISADLMEYAPHYGPYDQILQVPCKLTAQ